MRNVTNNQARKEGKQIAAKSAVSLTLLTALIGTLIITPVAQAQGLGPDQDSLLPPEVVPLDANGGASMQASQQQAMQAGQQQAQRMGSFNAPASFNSPAMSNAPQAPVQQMQTPAEWRKAAYDSMMNNPNAQPIFAPQQQAQMGQMPGQPGANGQPAVGQSGWQSGNGQAMATSTQSQTLSGQVQQPNYNKKGGPSKLSGLAHTASMATMVGSGVLMGALMMRRSPGYGIYSSGMMGASMLNYGMRTPLGMW
jgi:hypothetical protein